MGAHLALIKRPEKPPENSGPWLVLRRKANGGQRGSTQLQRKPHKRIKREKEKVAERRDRGKKRREEKLKSHLACNISGLRGSVPLGGRKSLKKEERTPVYCLV